jgi:hypothetical protein
MDEQLFEISYSKLVDQKTAIGLHEFPITSNEFPIPRHSDLVISHLGG